MQHVSELQYDTPPKNGDPREPHSPIVVPSKVDIWGVLRSPQPQSPTPATEHSWLVEPHTPIETGHKGIFGVGWSSHFQMPPRVPFSSPVDPPSPLVEKPDNSASPRTVGIQSHSCEEPAGLVIDFRGQDYTGNRVWVNRIPNRPDAHVPSTILFDDAEKAFLFSSGGDVITVPLATNGNVMRDVSYAVWVKVPTEFPKGNLGWVITQSPDYAWSRALTLNDYRLGHVSITTSGYWDSKLGQAPVGRWCHVVGVWRQGGESTVYLNGVRGETIAARNGRGSHPSECLSIGGRGPGDRVHNPPILISSVSVYQRVLSDAEVAHLCQSGRSNSTSQTAGRDVENDEWSPRVMRRIIASQEAPKWDDATKLFWCSTGVNVYELPDGNEWQQEFKEKLQNTQQGSSRPPAAAPVAPRRVLRVQQSDAQEPPRAQRGLARHPSDPEKRATRAAYSSALQQMPRRAGVSLPVHGLKVALFRFLDRVFAVSAECPHQGGALVEGEVGDIEDMVDGRKCYITCPVHKFQFDLATGAVLDGRCGRLPTYATRIVEADYERKRGMIEVGFESLAADYFHEFDVDDF